MAEKKLYILIADRNSNVSELLRREFADRGYRAGVARDCNQVIGMLKGDDRPDLVIVDPEISCSENLTVMALLSREAIRIPVVLYSFEPDTLGETGLFEAVVKKGADTDRLKGTVDRIFRRYHPEHFPYQAAHAEKQ
ncbi:MAG: hypothetical protein HZB23_06590 [Deltaproteobacteria bacterium]|nr:hypothetical protein [Deltaproteobacteria bacterium]